MTSTSEYTVETFSDPSYTYRVVTDPDGKTCISVEQAWTLDEQRAISYSQVGVIFLSIMGYAREHGLRLRGTESHALAFLMTTSGVGNLWFDRA